MPVESKQNKSNNKNTVEYGGKSTEFTTNVWVDLFGILFIPTEIRLYIPFSDWLGAKHDLCLDPNQSVNGKFNLISVDPWAKNHNKHGVENAENYGAYNECLSIVLNPSV